MTCRGSDDHDLLERAGRGDGAAFAAWASQHDGALLRTATVLLGSRHEAEDVVQEALLNAYRALIGGKRPENPRSWLFAILRNCCIDQQRAARFTDVLPENAISPSDTAATVEVQEDVEQVLRAIGDLPAAQRAVVVDRELNGDSYAELARRHDTTVSAIKSTLFRARRSLAASRPVQSIFGPLTVLTQRAPAVSSAADEGSAGKVTLGALAVLAKVVAATAVTSGVLLVAPPVRPESGSASGGPRAPFAVRPAPVRRPVVVATYGPGAHRSAGAPQVSPGERARTVRGAIAACIAGAPVDRYDVAVLQEARRRLPVDVAEYTGCSATLQTAARTAAAVG